MSVYPASIDSNLTIIDVVNNVTPIDSKIYNQYKSAIIAIEQELGVKPSGTYATVRARLDALEAGSGGGGGITVNGDLTISSIPVPGTIRVAGLQGSPVSTTPPIIGQVLGWNGTAWIGITVPSLGVFTISLFGRQFVEVGQQVTGPSFFATYSTAPVSAVLTDNNGSLSEDVISNPYHFISKNLIGPNGFLKTNFGDSVIFTLTASDGANITTDNTKIVWVNYVYFGTGTAGQNSSSFIKSLPNVLSDVQLTTFTANAASNEKIYYAYRTAFGAATFVFNGLSGGFTLVSTTIPVTNNFGFTENYTLYESNNLGLGLTTFDIF